jgi:tRNA modification GTPase
MLCRYQWDKPGGSLVRSRLGAEMTPDIEDTIVALSSAPGPGGRAIIRLSGSSSLPFTLAFFRSDEPVGPSLRRRYPGHLKLVGVHSPLPGDLYVWPGPRSYTGQDMTDIHILSCPPLVDLLIAQLMGAGARAAQPGEFTLRAFLAGKMDLTRAEAVLGVIEATSRHDLNQALAQLAGGMAGPLQGLRSDLLNLLADVEAGLDFTDEDIRFVEQQELLGRLTRALAQLTILQKQLASRAIETGRFRAVLVGPPNAGKSSLFNAIAGKSSALVSAQPGTTRDYLVHRLTWEEITIELIDTAGWQVATGMIETQSQALGREQSQNADLLVVCLEAGGPGQEQEMAILENKNGRGAIAIATKCDLAPAPPDRLATSAITGQGINELKKILIEFARKRASPGPAPSLSRCRHHVDAALEHLRQSHGIVLHEEPPEMLALELRLALEHLGEMTGAVYTDELLDRIFSRFCIGK